MSLNKELIKETFLKHGFKLESQPDGTYDINAQIYSAAAELIEKLSRVGPSLYRREIRPSAAYDRKACFIDRPSRDDLDELHKAVLNGVVMLSEMPPNTAVGSNGTVLCNLGELRFQAEEAECVSRVMDDNAIPTVGGSANQELSLVGRIMLFAGKPLN